LLPGHRVLWIQPALKLLSFSEVEDAYNPSLHVSLAAFHTHDTENTQVLVVAEHIVLSEPESVREKLA
jgi:hypothetical protein